jgi:hypothetical protein
VSEGEVREELTPAERRLVGLLALLRIENGEAPGLTQAVVRRARWQLLVRDLARTAGLIATAIGNGVSLLLGDVRRRR